MRSTARTNLRGRLGVLIALRHTPPRTPIPGFLLDRGRYTTFDAPEAVLQTEPASVNNRGEIVGHYMDAAGIRHGFVRDRHGRFTTINVPGAKTGTVPLRINDRGQLVGYDENTAATASPQPAGTPPVSRMF